MGARRPTCQINTSPPSDGRSQLFSKVHISVAPVPGVFTLTWLKAWTEGAGDASDCVVKMRRFTPAAVQPCSASPVSSSLAQTHADWDVCEGRLYPACRPLWF